ncbi:MAG: hypothetical protein VSS75_023045 [Candidatus Parabeggiatoa sp.]|nr:hypothetical protein [Candidatus Parabeggiatoa sp.]
MEIYEFSIKKKIFFDKLKSVLSKAFRVPESKIGTSTKFYDSYESLADFELGIEVENQDSGFSTFIKCASKKDLTENDIFNIACTLSVLLTSEVAIGDITYDSDISTGDFLVITPDKFVYRAYEDADLIENEDIFELKARSRKISITDFVKKFIES